MIGHGNGRGSSWPGIIKSPNGSEVNKTKLFMSISGLSGHRSTASLSISRVAWIELVTSDIELLIAVSSYGEQ